MKLQVMLAQKQTAVSSENCIVVNATDDAYLLFCRDCYCTLSAVSPLASLLTSLDGVVKRVMINLEVCIDTRYVKLCNQKIIVWVLDIYAPGVVRALLQQR